RTVATLLCRSRRSSAGRRSSIVTKPTAKEAKERRESEREPKKTAKSAELAKSFKELLSTAHGVPHSHKLNERVHVLRHR
ncbi:hypothetical protein H9L39_07567, partial [Fusarium oxysporum f. sp. albedinis]